MNSDAPTPIDTHADAGPRVVPQRIGLRQGLWLGMFLIVWFYGLGARTLVPTDEGRYAEMAREMLATGDWITPRLNGIKYFEKPPLQVWMTALTFKAFGLGEWQARLWSGLTGLLGIWLTWYTGRRLFGPPAGDAAGLVLASSVWWAGFAHVNALDTGLSAMLCLALCGLLLAQSPRTPPRERAAWMCCCWAGMALAVLSKGLIGVLLPAAVLAIYAVVARDRGIWMRLRWSQGLPIFLALAAPWFVLVSLENPEFAEFFFVHEHLLRYTSEVHDRSGPWFYFIPLLLAGMLPWPTLLPKALYRGWRHQAPDKAASAAFQPARLLVVWAVFIFVFFSASGSKLPTYILPIFPALALLAGLAVQQESRPGWMIAAGLSLLLGLVGVAAVPIALEAASDLHDLSNRLAAAPFVLAAGLCLLVAGTLVLRWAQQRREPLAFRATLALAVGGFLAGQLVLLATEPFGRDRSGLALVPSIRAELGSGARLFSVARYDQTLPFYLQRTMTLVASPNELEFGLRQEPHLWLPRLEDFFAEWRTGGSMVAVTRPEILDELRRRGLAVRLVAADARRVVITNDGPSP